MPVTYSYTGMRNLSYKISFWLLTIAAFCSCSSMDSDPKIDTDGTGTIIISGTVSEAAGNTPIEGIKIIFQAFDSEENNSEPIKSINAYTDSQGAFNITAEGFTSAVTGTIATDHQDYSNVMKELMVTWKGTSYDPDTRTFYINNCDFRIEKKK